MTPSLCRITTRDTARLDFVDDGAIIRRRAVDGRTLERIETALSGVPQERAGMRLHGLSALSAPLAAEGAIGRLAAELLGPRARPVRAVLFDKNPAVNWALGWHQDRTIVVRRRLEIEGFGPWSTKSGLQHVAPPFDLLASMVTVRAHFDDVDEANAPLLIGLGSHRRGRVPEAKIQAVVAECAIMACLAARGDAWFYATPILHASDAAVLPRRRRVLQVDYCARDLPAGLEWLGI